MSDPETPKAELPISLFDYELPDELIAQRPLENRAESRLLVVQRETGTLSHTEFSHIADWLRPGDVLVLNDTRVFPARLIGLRETGGQVEFLVTQPIDGDKWIAMARPSRRLRSGETLRLLDQEQNPSRFSLTIREKRSDGTLIVELPHSELVFSDVGRTPLPHYISERLEDADRYQTVYAQQTGSVAAPTAGLHFTDQILNQLGKHGVELAWLTLHVGPGTFQPVKVEDAAMHRMHAERYEVTPETIQTIRRAREEGRRVIAVGTTSCRTLEAIADSLDCEGWLVGETSIYITPGFQFRVVGGLLTNFHLPKSTLMLLVSAFAGRELVLRCYAEAIEEKYRFYSFGDAMLLV